jgi:hypothetical protein
METSIFTLLLLLTVFVVGICSHKLYLDRIYKCILATSNRSVSKDILYIELSIAQGSNFNSFAIGSWMLFFVSLAYMYFLTPTIFIGFNYFQVPAMASNPIGFLVFGIFIILLTSLISASLPGMYSFYEISKRIKTAITLTFPLLGISLVCSAYIGTLYPISTPLTEIARIIAFTMLLISLVILLSPVYIGLAGVTK